MLIAVQRLPDFARLMRLDRPIGTLLLLWPTLWSLWFAAGGLPDLDVLLIFVLGVTLMRAAGCVINDYADRHIDGAVVRTRDRPLATGKVAPREALWLFAGLCLVAFLLILLTNRLTVLLSFGGAALAVVYPFAKRHTHLPQFVLGAAWAWCIPMAFAAQTGAVPPAAWSLYAGVVLWTVAFDTYYAMVDRDDDRKLGVKSTAILFGADDLLVIGALQALALFAFALSGNSFGRGLWYYLGLGAMALWFFHQHHLARQRDRRGCFRAFLGNNRAGATLFLFILLDYHWPPGPG
jgi:4-hydroxybenzoate polyprenyltransferase